LLNSKPNQSLQSLYLDNEKDAQSPRFMSRNRSEVGFHKTNHEFYKTSHTWKTEKDENDNDKIRSIHLEDTRPNTTSGNSSSLIKRRIYTPQNNMRI